MPAFRTQVSIIGAGSGTALAVVANRNGNRVMMYSRNQQAAFSIEQTRIHERLSRSVFIDPAIRISCDLRSTSHNADTIILAIPAQAVRGMCIALSDHVAPHVPIVIASKGIERGSLALMSEVVQSTLPSNPIAVLSGPNFALEAAQGLPTATTIASKDMNIADRIAGLFGGSFFRPYLSDDIIGAQIGGAIKNVIAVAAGIARGHGMGENAQAALLTRGIVEMQRLSRAKGGKEETLMGLSGIGDLLLTATSPTSRNYAFGVEVGKAGCVETILHTERKLIEGVYTTDSAYELAMKLGVSMPLVESVYAILQKHEPIAEVIQSLLDRPVVRE